MPTRGRARPLMNSKKFKLWRLTFFWNLYILNPLLVYNPRLCTGVCLMPSLNQVSDNDLVARRINEYMMDCVGEELLYLPSNKKSNGDTLWVI